MSDTNKKPNLSNFEKYVAEKNYETACVELLDILSQIDVDFGDIRNIEFDYPTQLNEELEQEKLIYFCTRIAVAISNLFIDPELNISESGAARFFTLQRWITMIFASSPFVNTDHILKHYNCNPNSTNPLDITLDNKKSTLIKFCILYLPESNVKLNLDALWKSIQFYVHLFVLHYNLHALLEHNRHFLKEV